MNSSSNREDFEAKLRTTLRLTAPFSWISLKFVILEMSLEAVWHGAGRICIDPPLPSPDRCNVFETKTEVNRTGTSCQTKRTEKLNDKKRILQTKRGKRTALIFPVGRLSFSFCSIPTNVIKMRLRRQQADSLVIEFQVPHRAELQNSTSSMHHLLPACNPDSAGFSYVCSSPSSRQHYSKMFRACRALDSTKPMSPRGILSLQIRCMSRLLCGDFYLLILGPALVRCLNCRRVSVHTHTFYRRVVVQTCHSVVQTFMLSVRTAEDSPYRRFVCTL